MKKRFSISQLMPLLLTILGGACFVYLGIWRILKVPFIFEGLLIALALGCYFTWMLVESRISAKEISKSAHTKDHASMELAAISKMILLFTAIAFTERVRWPLALPGLALMGLGIYIRLKAIMLLGFKYSHRIRLPELPLEENGAYGVVRHPAYLGTLIGHVGLTLVLFNMWSLAALTFLWLPVVALRTFIEEKFLQLMPAYQDYSHRVRYRLVPYIW